MSDIYLKGTDPTRIRLDLVREEALLTLLGEPHKRLCYVHVGGTNGKGSTSACIASILKCAGYRVGLFTSPALERFNERLRINGEEISDGALSELDARVRACAAGMADPPTEFELSAAMAFLYFEEQVCDIAIMEVGLGGAGDATNVIPAPECAVLTAMGYDHTAILGKTMTEIASVKAGIIKPGCTVVSCGNDPEAQRVFAEVSESLGCPMVTEDPGRVSEIRTSLGGSRFVLAPYGEVGLGLTGSYQVQNALLAVTAAEALRGRGWRLPDEAVLRGLKEVRWAGRFEVLSEKPVFLLDGGHNPHGVRAAMESLAAVLPGVKPVFLIGVMADKAVDEILTLLLTHAERFVTVTADNPRAMKADALAERIRALGGIAEAAPDMPSGIAAALKHAGTDGAVMALGTLYFSAAVRRELLKHLR